MRKNNMRIIQISGLRGILMVAFIATCLIAGFVAFPAIVAMHVISGLAFVGNCCNKRVYYK